VDLDYFKLTYFFSPIVAARQVGQQTGGASAELPESVKRAVMEERRDGSGQPVPNLCPDRGDRLTR